MRSVLVISTLVVLILLAFSPVWYSALSGDNQVIVAPTEAEAGQLIDAGS
jgi:hypothetical protein